MTFPTHRMLGLICAVVAGWTTFAAETPFERECAALTRESGQDAERLHQLFKLHWDYSMREHPERATRIGYPGQNDRWTDDSLEAIARRKRELQSPLKVLHSIDRVKPTDADQLSYDLFLKNSERAIEGTRFPGEYFQITQLGGIQQDIAQLLELAPHATVKDYEDLIARLRGVPTVVEQTLALLKQGLATSITPPRLTLRDVPQQVKAQMVEDPSQNTLLQHFQKFPPAIPEAEQARLRRAAHTALKEEVLPAFARLHNFLVKEYVPGARESIAMGDLPGGRAWYEFNARVSTTTTLTPQQIHEIGLAEVKRIRAEMDKVITKIEFRGSFAEFLEFLRKDRRFYCTNADDLLRGYRDIC
jgi:uncharacterized protein (DUF885 family)